MSIIAAILVISILGLLLGLGLAIAKNTPKAITTTIKQIPQLAKDLVEAERTITKEIEEQGRARGGNEALTLFDNGITID